MAEITYRYHRGDLLCLHHGNPLAPAGDYALLEVGEVVTLARLVRTSRGQALSRKNLYLMITDLCMFEETGRNYHVPEVRHRERKPDTVCMPVSHTLAVEF